MLIVWMNLVLLGCDAAVRKYYSRPMRFRYITDDQEISATMIKGQDQYKRFFFFSLISVYFFFSFEKDFKEK